MNSRTGRSFQTIIPGIIAALALLSNLDAAPAPEDFLRPLEKWHATAVQLIHQVEDDPQLAYYGTGGHEHWAVQAHCTAFSAFAVMSTAPELDEKKVGISREQLRERALQMMRYILRAHQTGDRACISGKKWGHSWIAALGLERMAHGIAALRPWLTADDLALMRRVMISESDFILKGYPVGGAIDNATGKNKPESNIWNGSMLYRTASLYPDTPNAAKYREKATSLFLNGISIPSDASSGEMFSGKPLSKWHVGPNYTENFALNHHGYLNEGYMVICLSNIAMLHYFCRDYGINAPPELYHNAARLWQLVKTLTFPDGRLWRIGGDTRVRYCYCQDYALPAWVFVRDFLGDTDTDRFMSGWLKQVVLEQSASPDGAFLGERLADLAQVSPLYYCRLEGDRAETLSLAAWWLRRYPDPGRTAANPVEPLKSWQDEFHGAQMVKGRRRSASWVWKAGELPSGQVAPSDRSDLVEWQWNLAGRISGAGCETLAGGARWQSWQFEGGFATCGSYEWTADKNPAEGSGADKIAAARTAYVALPDDATVVVLQRAETLRPVHINRVMGLYLNVPNDIYNGGKRNYRIDGVERQLTGAGSGPMSPKETIRCKGGTLEIDGRITVGAVYGDDGLTLYRPGRRQVNLAHNLPLAFSGRGGNLYCDVVCMAYNGQQKYYKAKELLYDIGAVIRIDGKVEARKRPEGGTMCRVLEIAGADGRHYLLAVNFDAGVASIEIPGIAYAAVKVCCGKADKSTSGGLTLSMDAGQVTLLSY